MPQGEKSSYTDKQKRQAEHIEESYEERGVSEMEAEARAWATVNKETGGGKKSGSGRGKKTVRTASRKGGRKAAAKKTTRKSTAKKGGRKTAAKKTARKSTARKSTAKKGGRKATKRSAGAKGGRKTARKRSSR
jgi:plasmid stabilization system protein ParE